MKKSKLVLNTIAVILFFLFCLICNSADWLIRVFGKLDFSTVLYQLNSPMKGTSHEILQEYLVGCLAKTIIEVVFLVLIYIFLCLIQKKLSFQIIFSAFEKKKKIDLFSKNKRITKVIFGMFLCCIGIGMIYEKACMVGIPQYIEKISNPSNFYEEYYVDPNTVEISFPEKKRNLIYIYMESMETTYASKEVGGGKDINYIPNLTKLAEQNISFSDTEKLGGFISYGGSGWTMAALLASTSGTPYLLPIEGNSAENYEEILPGLTSIGDILEAEGYRNYFMCGSDASFGGRKLYFEQHGNYTIYDYYSAINDGLIPSDYYEFWGFEDRKLYQYAKDKLEMIAASEEPFNFTLLTVDTHHMNGYICPLCENEYSEDYPNVIACADRQIQEFIEWIMQQAWYENTTVILVGDHTSMNNNFWDDLEPEYNRRVYNCFINADSEVEILNVTDRVFYSMDLFPTTLSSLGVKIEGNRLGLGTDLFSEMETLGEQLGAEQFQTESMRYSRYYNNQLIQGKKK